MYRIGDIRGNAAVIAQCGKLSSLISQSRTVFRGFGFPQIVLYIIGFLTKTKDLQR